MTILFAQLAMPSPEAIGIWLLVALIVAGVWLRARKIERELRGQGERREISPQPIRVQEEPEYVDRDTYEKDRRDLRDEMGRQARNRKELYEKVEELGARVQANATKTDLTYAQLQTLDGKMDRVLERLPRPKE